MTSQHFGVLVPTYVACERLWSRADGANDQAGERAGQGSGLCCTRADEGKSRSEVADVEIQVCEAGLDALPQKSTLLLLGPLHLLLADLEL